MLIINFGLCRLDQLLEFSNLEFQKLNRALGGDLLSLESSGEFERRLELAGEGFEAVNDVLWDVRSRLRSVVFIVVKDCKGRFGGSRSTNLAARPTTILVFHSSFFVLLIHPLQLVWNDSHDTMGVIIVT